MPLTNHLILAPAPYDYKLRELINNRKKRIKANNYAIKHYLPGKKAQFEYENAVKKAQIYILDCKLKEYLKEQK